MNRVVLYGVQFLNLMSVVSANLLHPEYSMKILNTENIVMSLDNLDDMNNDDLELIQNVPNNPDLDEKLHWFHKFIKMAEVVEYPEEKLHYDLSLMPNIEAAFPERKSPTDRSQPDGLGKDKKKNKKERLKRLRLSRKIGKKGWVIGKRAVPTNTPGTGTTEQEYDYLQKDYEELVEKSRQNNTIFKYSDEGKPEESFKEVIQKITDIKTPKNCTNATGIGVQAVECLVQRFQKKEMSKSEMADKATIIFLVWFAVYTVIAVPLWCSRGWCCCWFRCAFCFPNDTVKKIQKYIAENPPGVLVNSKGEEEHYSATAREIELYQKIKKSVAEF